MNTAAPLWTSDAIAAATGGTAGGAFACAGVSIDSRTVAAGDLFIAIAGPSHDGHAFVAEALAKGAAGALVHAPVAGADPARLITVPDTFTALEALGRAGRARTSARVLGVTGSVGKTSTKEMAALAFAALGPTHAAVGSFNNHWGVPLTLARLPAASAFAVIEMGMNHAGELRALTAQARPHAAIVTAIAPAHIEFFGTLDAIADAKAEIFEGVVPGGAAILPVDSPQYACLKAHAEAHALRTIGFGRAPEADIRLMHLETTAAGSVISASLNGRRLTFSMATIGAHFALDALAVLAAVEALGEDVNAPAAALAAMTPPKGRGQRRSLHLRGGLLTVVDETYNANPESVAAALAALASTPPAAGGRRIVVLGDMLELGAAGPALHAGLADRMSAAGVDAVFGAGPLTAHLMDALPPALRAGHAPDSEALAPLVAAAVGPGDVVVVKGSFGSRMGRVVDALLALDTAPRSPRPD